ncbi:uncharacterized protein BDZ99DRAFT_520328 [Mytilinidion resinicola]|uniref:Uncharacterized protein n=1 Tax=Mytilinidion resinicola TaxID=574789 RepID=A0A6A6YN86_9PEZI|nr:uncharacterized protein BDZ99DRAFT_520328 [Mytilinidion resinicola]KAF2810250.1 hypothetical protein BDZ99DRAFT_520328 [Mytilinidion resinicola]
MYFLKYFTVVLLSALAIATPSPVQKGAELPQRVEERAPLNTDITSLLTNIIPDVQALTCKPRSSSIRPAVPYTRPRLTTDSINGIKTLLSNAEALLTEKFVYQQDSSTMLHQ